jgi:hypothetical protein
MDMEIYKANILMYLGMLGALACLPTILMAINGPTGLWGYEAVPGSGDITSVDFYDRNNLFVTGVSLLLGSSLMAAGLLGFLVIHRNPMSIIGSAALIVSAYYTWIWFEELQRLVLHRTSEWMTGDEWVKPCFSGASVCSSLPLLF